MPGYVKQALQKFNYEITCTHKNTNAPHPYKATKKLGLPMTHPTDDSVKLSPHEIKHLQQIVGTFLFLFQSRRPHHNRSLQSSGGLMADVPCLDHSLDSCKGRPDDVQTTKHARRTHAWSRCARTSLGAHASLFGASGARFWIVTRATSARIEEPSMVSILYIKSSIPDTYK